MGDGFLEALHAYAARLAYGLRPRLAAPAFGSRLGVVGRKEELDGATAGSIEHPVTLEDGLLHLMM
jgi:hypothetical protein